MTNAIFTPEKVRELADDIAHRWSTGGIERSITEWLKKYQPEPVVAGLSDEQVRKLSMKILVAESSVACATIDTYYDAISKYAGVQENRTRLEPCASVGHKSRNQDSLVEPRQYTHGLRQNTRGTATKAYPASCCRSDLVQPVR